jgi:endoglucanase
MTSHHRALFAVFCAACVSSTGAIAASPMAGGVNLSGMEINAGTIPGVVNYDYVVPTLSELEYYRSKGLLLIRLPVLWERLQPNLLSSSPGSALSMQYLNLVKHFIGEAGALGMRVIVDIHDYGGYGGHKIGDGTLRPTMFSSFWRQLAAKLAGLPGLAAYDLMNEPSNMPNASVWPIAAQDAVTAVRGVDPATAIYVEGDDWSSAATWTTYNNGLNIKDPSSNLIYEAHVYGDSDDSGTNFIWSVEASQGVTVNTIAQRVAVFTGWCQTNQRRCMIGEVGVGNDDPSWNTELANGLTAMQSGAMLSFTYWAGGPWWGSYPMSIEPTSSGDAPQMSVVSLYGQ